MTPGRPDAGREGAWQISVDAGGTFTDAVGTSPGGHCVKAKVLSSGVLRGVVVSTDEAWVIVRERWGVPDGFCVGARLWIDGRCVGVVTHDEPWDQGRRLRADGACAAAGALVEVWGDEDAVLLAARVLTGTGFAKPLPAIAMRLATTRGTNALLERRGAKVALFVTEGFEDLLEIGTQQRPYLFRLRIEKPAPLHSNVHGVRGRLDAQGNELTSLDEAQLRRDAIAARAYGCESACVVLMHAWRNDAHEAAAERVLRACGFGHVTCSSRVAPTIRLLARAQTSVVDAYLAPLVAEYASRASRACRAGLHVMSSAGGLVRSDAFHAKDSLLSGPAGGVAGAWAAGKRSGFSRVLSFDMGGTSTDVARCADDAHLEREHHVGDATIVAPAVGVATVAAGGGSICWFDEQGHGTLRVGPASAGANPGPACYGAGGPLTITDCNLLLGRLPADRLGIPVFAEAARARAGELCAMVERHTGRAPDARAMLAGLLEIANARMAQAIREVSIARGFHASDHALVAFGGAGGQHACAIAEILGMSDVVVPADAGLLSAVGVAGACLQREAQRQVLRGLDELWLTLDAEFDAMERSCTDELASDGVDAQACSPVRLLSMRIPGQEASLTLERGALVSLEQACAVFAASFVKAYGYEPQCTMPEVESLMVVVRGPAGESPQPPAEHRMAGGVLETTSRVWFDGEQIDVPLRERASIPSGEYSDGPALIIESHATTFVHPGWSYKIDSAGAIVMRRARAHGVRRAEQPEAVKDAVFLGRIGSIVAEMGRMLERTARSTNVKERLDYSCALLDSEGQLVVNAPHIPVHLGALGECVRAVARVMPMRPGDTVVTNHPAFGGSHLPDITLITPVFLGERRVGYVANRAHHAEIGGLVPGSLPPLASRLSDEGVVIPPMLVVQNGVMNSAAIENVLRGARYPSRAVEVNLADLRAQIAANVLGANLLAEYANLEGADVLGDRMRRVHSHCEAAMRLTLGAMGAYEHAAVEEMDDGSRICVKVTIRDGAGVIDFAGTSGVHPNNMNAPAGVIRSAVLYVLRLLVNEDLPLSEGLMTPITLRIPVGMLNPAFEADPEACPAVAAGNVETSQRVVDALLKAFGVAACSQGTMNNVIFGNDRFSFYETICGGSGAGPGFDGSHGVHTHMTNTRITDPEIIEHRYPVRIERFGLRHGSGGVGRWRGGDGVVRSFLFLDPVSLAVLAQHRKSGPYGLSGGGEGMPGCQRVTRADGHVIDVPGVVMMNLGAGDRFTIETPGGGGCDAIE